MNTVFSKILIVVCLLFMSLPIQAKNNDKLPIDTKLSENEEMRITIDNIQTPVLHINFNNSLKEESIIMHSAFLNGEEVDDDGIGKEILRTYTLQSKKDDDVKPIQMDRKTIIMETSNFDELYIKVLKGEVSIKIKEEKEKKKVKKNNTEKGKPDDLEDETIEEIPN